MILGWYLIYLLVVEDRGYIVMVIRLGGILFDIIVVLNFYLEI